MMNNNKTSDLQSPPNKPLGELIISKFLINGITEALQVINYAVPKIMPVSFLIVSRGY